MKSLNRFRSSNLSKTTVKQSLLWGFRLLSGKKIFSALLDAELLLSEALRKKQGAKDRSWLGAHAEYILTKKELTQYKKFLFRRTNHEPLACIIRHKEFYGLDFYINKNVLIPRPETETLIETLCKDIADKNIVPEENIFIDIGAGSGCIPITVAKLCNFSRIYAIDISAKALSVARLNAKNHNVTKKIQFIKGSLFTPLADKPEIKNAAHLAISANLPYIKSANMKTLPESVLRYEPALALDGGKSGIILISELLSEINSFIARSRKIKTIRLFLEIGAKQKKIITEKIKKYFKKADVFFTKDLRGKNRLATVAIKPDIC